MPIQYRAATLPELNAKIERQLAQSPRPGKIQFRHPLLEILSRSRRGTRYKEYDWSPVVYVNGEPHVLFKGDTFKLFAEASDLDSLGLERPNVLVYDIRIADCNTT